jgi:hypothetical protein
MPPLDRIGDNDTQPFKDAKIPLISNHSVSQEKCQVLHSKSDNIEAIS